jgi:hypothetical protein
MNIRKAFTLLLYIFPNLLIAQGLSHEWVNTWGSISNSHVFGSGIGVDAAGNTYVAGSFRSTMDADPGPGVWLLVPSGIYNVFVCKFSPSGNLIWAGAITSGSECGAGAMKVDALGNVLVAGYMIGTTDFDFGLGFTNLTTVGRDLFLAKYDTNGGLVWAKALNSTSNATGLVDNDIFDMHIDATGNIYLTGTLETPIDFDPSAGTAIQTPVSSYDAFAAKYDPAGNYVLAFILAGTSLTTAEGNGITADAAGNIYLVGAFDGTIDLDPGLGTVSVTALASSSDAFIAKYAANGAYTWGFGQGASNFASLKTSLGEWHN